MLTTRTGLVGSTTTTWRGSGSSRTRAALSGPAMNVSCACGCAAARSCSAPDRSTVSPMAVVFITPDGQQGGGQLGRAAAQQTEDRQQRYTDVPVGEAKPSTSPTLHRRTSPDP